MSQVLNQEKDQSTFISKGLLSCKHQKPEICDKCLKFLVSPTIDNFQFQAQKTKISLMGRVSAL